MSPLRRSSLFFFSTLLASLPSAALDAQGPAVWEIPSARIAVSALHGPLRLSTLAGEDERAILVGNVNAQDWSPTGDRLV